MTDSKDGFSSEQLASRALAAACQRDRSAVITLLAKYGATKLPELRLKDLQPFTRECEAIEEPPPAPLPPVEMVPAFAIGERVRHLTLSAPMRVTGYQLRYVVDGGRRCVRAENLERVERVEAPPVSPTLSPTFANDWQIGAALMEATHKIGADKLGQSFANNAATLHAELIGRGLHIVRI